MKKILSLALALIMGFSLVACGSDDGGNDGGNDDTAENAVSVKVALGESYAIADEATEKIDTSNIYTSEDNAIAEVVGGKYIVGHAAGATTVTTKIGDTVTVYNVEVTDDEDDRLLKRPEVKNVTVYLGAGYNAFKASGYLSSGDLNMTRAIITPQTLTKEMKRNPYSVMQDTIREDKFVQIQGDSAQNYEKSYNTQIRGELSLSLDDFVGVSVSGKYTDAKGNTNNNATVFNTILSYNKRIRYSVNLPSDRLTKLARENSTAWKQLTGEDGTTASKFFELYGTHILLSTDLGGRMEFDYLLTANDSSVTAENLLSISGSINASISSVKADVSGSYEKSGIDNQKNSNTSAKTTVRTYGGAANASTLITNLESFQSGYSAWYSSLAEDNYSFIGTTDAGLLPVWYLLDPQENADRIQELQEEYNRTMDSIKGSL